MSCLCLERSERNDKNYESTEEFVANYMRIYTCDRCGHGTPAGLEKHQRHIAFRPEDQALSYPCFRIGGTDPVPGNPETDLHFCIFRHTEDWESNYNVQLDKFDYETGKPLENSVFELYERFDDKDQINRGHDGAVELYEGIENDSDQEWQSKYTSSPVVWDDFRLVNSFTTDTNR